MLSIIKCDAAGLSAKLPCVSLLLFAVVVILSAGRAEISCAADSIQGLIPVYSDSVAKAALSKNCNYCHSLHNARSDVAGMLNEREERYAPFMSSGNIWSDSPEASVFGSEISGKCPRSRTGLK